MPARSGSSSQRGFSVLEALISIVIASAVIVTLLGVIAFGFNQTQINATQVQAVSLGQQYLDAVRNAEQSFSALPVPTTAPVDQGDSFLTGSPNAVSSYFTIVPNACPISNPGPTASQYDCAVTVTWSENGAAKSVKVETYVTR